jgi:hypothetical protein
MSDRGHLTTATGTPADLLDRCESALACLRHIHDRLIEYPEFETLRVTINRENRELAATITKARANGT